MSVFIPSSLLSVARCIGSSKCSVIGIMKISEIKPEVYDMAERAMAKIRRRFDEIDAVAEFNTRKVMEAFQDNRVSEACFAGTTGYGYDDLGRDTLDKIYAQVFGTEAALVRIGFVNGTHSISRGFSIVITLIKFKIDLISLHALGRVLVNAPLVIGDRNYLCSLT